MKSARGHSLHGSSKAEQALVAAGSPGQSGRVCKATVGRGEGGGAPSTSTPETTAVAPDRNREIKCASC